MNITCPITGVCINLGRFFAAALAVFVFVFVYEYVLHGVLLMDVYMQTPEVWRPVTEMEGHFAWALVLQIVFSLVAVKFYAFFCKEPGLGEGLLFGSFLGAVIGIWQFSAYIYLPISMTLASYWLGSMFAEGLLVGALAGLIYRKP